MMQVRSTLRGIKHYFRIGIVLCLIFSCFASETQSCAAGSHPGRTQAEAEKPWRQEECGFWIYFETEELQAGYTTLVLTGSGEECPLLEGLLVARFGPRMESVPANGECACSVILLVTGPAPSISETESLCHELKCILIEGNELEYPAHEGGPHPAKCDRYNQDPYMYDEVLRRHKLHWPKTGIKDLYVDCFFAIISFLVPP